MNEDQKLLLTDWFRRARESQYIHYASAEYYSNKHYWLGIPSMALGVIVGTAVFASFETEATGAFKIALGLISILASVLTALNTFLDFSSKAEKHRTAAAGYSSIRKTLERIKTSEQNYINTFDNEMEKLQKELDALADKSPNPPKKVSKKEINRLKSTEHKKIFHIPASR
ncbi:SLATT domain-containing protein [Pseudoalteromonas sp. MMG024]|uniref:SLATT domain-containing protein n=1 Tax=Pseudoalteromonas sp. MMG024 TaxID=2909980 RepID=UPI001F2EDC86|nr:SLATT domain-containing protein [Pseudoalteromonas sp. MMG024]MCF6459153.1 SLATT domain-containing protein [Pseudoalteromonas sp. MMG024]